MAKNCPTSLKKTLSTPEIIPSPIANKMRMPIKGNTARYTIPGKEFVTSKKKVNKLKTIKKFSAALPTMMAGKHNLGKESFFKILALSKNIF